MCLLRHSFVFPSSYARQIERMSKKKQGALVNPSVVNELIAGSVGGAAQVIVGQPLDTIKTRAQIAPRAYDYKICVP